MCQSPPEQCSMGNFIHEVDGIKKEKRKKKRKEKEVGGGKAAA